MSKFRMNSIVRLCRFFLPKYFNHRFFLHLAIIRACDFRGMVSYPHSPSSFVVFSFPRWLDFRVLGFLNYLLSFPISLFSFIYSSHASPHHYLYDASRYAHDGNMCMWVDNVDLELVSTQFCRQSTRQCARRRTRQYVRHCVRQYFRHRTTLRSKPIFRHRITTL